MLKILFLIVLIGFFGISTNQVFSQEMNLSTFQESAQVIIDKKLSQNVTASVTLLSTNPQEIKIPTELQKIIKENDRIKVIILTNHNNCILGVYDQSCIIVNVERDPEDKGINAIQDSTRELGESIIDEVNQVFDTNAKFFQTYIHTDGSSSQAFDTSGIVSGKGTISAVFTLPMEDTDSMYRKISTMLVSKEIRNGGGFFNVANTLSQDSNSKMSFSIIPMESKFLSQLRVSINYPGEAPGMFEIDPLKFLKTEELERSNYFSKGNYPLNSIFQMVITSNENASMENIKGNIIKTQLQDGIEMPTEITKKGWIFDPKEGEIIQGKYIFGLDTSINKDELKLTISGNPNQETELDETLIVVIIIAIVSIGAAIFYLKGYKNN
jgi:hypothetical protein